MRGEPLSSVCPCWRYVNVSSLLVRSRFVSLAPIRPSSPTRNITLLLVILRSLDKTIFSKVSMDHATPFPFPLQPSAINRFCGNDAPTPENTRLTAQGLL